MKKIFRKIYFIIPFKKPVFVFLRLFWTPSKKIAGYLKFRGKFKLNISENKYLIIKNDNSTLPSLFFWHGLKKYEPTTINSWIKLSSEAKVIFDVGANFGIFGLIGKVVNPKSKVHFFEPLDRNIERIKTNCSLNNFNNSEIYIETCAVSDKSGEVIFYDMDSSENTIGSMEKAHVELHQHHTSIIPKNIIAISLDDYIIQNNINSIDLVKIDVEGSELKVLQGFKEGIIKYQPIIFIEVLNRNSFNSITQLISEYNSNYLVYYLDEKQGLVKNNTGNFLRGNYIFSTLNISEKLN